jgi:hypothetical protein
VIYGLRRKQREGRTWCGPGALTILTGCSYEEAEEAIRETSSHYRARSPWGRVRPIVGTSAQDLSRALGRLGYVVEHRRLDDYGFRASHPTLGRFLAARGEDYGVPLLVQVTGHWVVVHAGDVADNNRAESIDDTRLARKWVRTVRAVRARAEFRTPRRGRGGGGGLEIRVSAKVLDVVGLDGGLSIEDVRPEGDLVLLRRTRHEAILAGTREAFEALARVLRDREDPAWGQHCSWVWSARRARIRVEEALGYK